MARTVTIEEYTEYSDRTERSDYDLMEFCLMEGLDVRAALIALIVKEIPADYLIEYHRLDEGNDTNENI